MDIFKELSCDEIDELSISEMKTILQQAALRKKDESSDVLWNITSNAMYILSIAGKRQIYDLVPELYKLLDHWDPYLREPAVANLGWWLKVPEFKERVYEIFVNDENHNVKFSALQSWTSYYADTKNSSVLEELYKILINDNYDIGVRNAALMGIFKVIGVWPVSFDPCTSDLIRCNLPSEFNSKVEWKEVTDLLKKYAPNALKNYPITRDEINELSISEMKTILQQAELIKDEENNDRILRNIKSNAMYILSIVGKRQIYDLVPELYKLLDHLDPDLREEAVDNLGWRLEVPEFKERVYEIFVNDENDNVKFSALLSWTSYYADTKNSSVLEELYKILINDNYYVGVRDVALMGIFDVIGVESNFYDPYTSDLIRCNLPSEFNSKVEWKEVTDLLKKYAPNALKNYPIQWTKEDYEKAKNVAKEDALNLINEGWDESKIIRQITGSILSIEEVEELKSSLRK